MKNGFYTLNPQKAYTPNPKPESLTPLNPNPLNP